MPAHQDAPRPPGWSYKYRSFPPCSCGQNGCNGTPEATIRLDPEPRTVTPETTRSKPLANPYKAELGALVYDALNGRLGILMERGPKGTAVFLRPERGGTEWEADARWLERPPTSLDEKLAVRNANSRLTEHRLGKAS
ncbi:hypothetical protein ACWC5I_02950 [Kitasatospora sp. NPDC001574]